LALAVPLSRFTPRVGGGSAFFVRPLHTFMKKKTIIIWLVMIPVFTITVLEVFDLHPKLAISRYSISWLGIMHMSFGSDNITLSSLDSPRTFKEYACGPFLFIVAP